MSTASISKPAIAAAVFLLAVAGCDSGVHGERPLATQASPNKPRPVEWYEARSNVLRARLDEGRGRIWTLHRDGVDLFDGRSDEKLRSIALPEWIWAEAFHSCPPDLVVGAGGEVIVSSNVLPVLWRIDPASFLVSRHKLAVVGQRGQGSRVLRDGVFVSPGLVPGRERAGRVAVADRPDPLAGAKHSALLADAEGLRPERQSGRCRQADARHPVRADRGPGVDGPSRA